MRVGVYMPTGREIAQLAGVSQATVSRVVQGSARVSEESRRRVEEAMAEAGYVPNAQARAMRTRSSGAIGVIIGPRPSSNQRSRPSACGTTRISENRIEASKPKRLIGWSKVKLNAGESKRVDVDIDPFYLSIFNVDQNGWQLVPGDYKFMVGGSSQELPLQQGLGMK